MDNSNKTLKKVSIIIGIIGLIVAIVTTVWLFFMFINGSSGMYDGSELSEVFIILMTCFVIVGIGIVFLGIITIFAIIIGIIWGIHSLVKYIKNRKEKK